MTQNIFEEITNTRDLYGPAAQEPDVASVDAEALQDLTEKYTQYRQALVKPGDPVRVLTMTGDVMAAVREIVVNGRTTNDVEAGELEPPQ